MLELILILVVISSAADYCFGQQTAQPQSPAGQDTQRSLTLAETVHLALNQNPNVQIALINSSLVKQEQRRALAALLPQARVGISETVNRINVESNLGTTAGILPQHEGPFQVLTTGIQFSAPVFNAALLEHYRAEQSAHSGSVSDAKAAREQIAQLAVSQYLLCLRLNSTMQADEAQVALAQRLFQQATNQQQAGAGTGLDTLRANQKVKVQQQALIVAREEAQTALFELVHLLNLPPSTTLTLSDSQSYVSRSFAETQEASIDTAYAQRPEMLALRSRIEAAKRERASARGERLPSLNINGSWDEQGNRFNNSIPTYQYQVSLSVPVFTGGRIRSEVASSTLRIDQLSKEEQEVKNRIAQEVKTAMNKLQSALQEVEVADAGLKLAHEEVIESQDRFQAGASDNIEVVTAQDTLARAYDGQIGALFRVNQARANLAHSIGKIEATYGK